MPDTTIAIAIMLGGSASSSPFGQVFSSPPSTERSGRNRRTTV